MRKGEKFKPTEEHRLLAKTLSGYGIPQEDIARQIGIDAKTLRKHLAGDLASGATMANAKVAESLFKQATSGKVPAATIFWCKARLGWKEKQEVEHTGNVSVTVNVNKKNARNNS